MKQKNRTALFVVLAVVVVIIVVYFSFFYPPPSSKKLTGTMVGIEKGKRDIDEQITIEEIIIENPEVNDIIQSAEFQNLIRDENFRKAVLSSDFQDIIIPLMSDFQRIAIFSQDFQNILAVWESMNTPEEMRNFIESDEFKKGFSEDFQKAILAMPQEQINIISSDDFNENEFFNLVLGSMIGLEGIDFSELYVGSQDFQDNLKDIDFNNWVINLSGPHLWSIIPEEQMKAIYLLSDDNIEALKVVYSNENFGAVLFSEDCLKIFAASDFQNVLPPLP